MYCVRSSAAIFANASGNELRLSARNNLPPDFSARVSRYLSAVLYARSNMRPIESSGPRVEVVRVEVVEPGIGSGPDPGTPGTRRSGTRSGGPGNGSLGSGFGCR